MMMAAKRVLLFCFACLALGHVAFGEGNASEICVLINDDTTPNDVQGPFYIADTPFTNRIAPEEQLDDPTQRLVVEGWVTGQNCAPLGHVLVEPWYAGLPDEEGNLYSVAGSDLNYRGSFFTDDCGYYNYTQTFPLEYPSRDILHVHFKFTSFDNETSEAFTLTTQMYFEGYTPEKYSRHLQGRESQIVNVTTHEDGARHVVFNVTLDIDGDEDRLTNGTCVPSNMTLFEKNDTLLNMSRAAYQSKLSSSAFLPPLAPFSALFAAASLLIMLW